LTASARHHYRPTTDRRRLLLTSLAATFMAPLAVQAQQPGKVPIIGLMGSDTAAGQKAWTTAFVERLRKATAAIPIVFATAGDPVGSGIVSTLARPGGNVTGLSSQAPDAAGKRLELLREVIPGLRRLAVLADVGNPYALVDAAEVEKAARPLGLEVMRAEMRVAEDIEPAFEAFKGRVQALYVICCS
jgi:ABC-type uncharacterized transport system substrate-binding protein